MREAEGSLSKTTSLWGAVSSWREAGSEDWVLSAASPHSTDSILNNSTGPELSPLCFWALWLPVQSWFPEVLENSWHVGGAQELWPGFCGYRPYFLFDLLAIFTSSLWQEALFCQHCVPHCPAYLILEALTVTRWLYNADQQEPVPWVMLSLPSVHEACERPCLSFGVFM